MKIRTLHLLAAVATLSLFVLYVVDQVKSSAQPRVVQDWESLSAIQRKDIINEAFLWYSMNMVASISDPGYEAYRPLLRNHELHMLGHCRRETSVPTLANDPKRLQEDAMLCRSFFDRTDDKSREFVQVVGVFLHKTFPDKAPRQVPTARPRPQPVPAAPQPKLNRFEQRLHQERLSKLDGSWDEQPHGFQGYTSSPAYARDRYDPVLPVSRLGQRDYSTVPGTYGEYMPPIGELPVQRREQLLNQPDGGFEYDFQRITPIGH